MRFVLFSLLSISLAAATGMLDVFGQRWSVPDSSDWKIERTGGTEVLHLVTPRNPLPGPRRPIQFALSEMPAPASVTLDADVRPLGRSLMLVFAYQDPAHFDYAHLSIDTGAQQPVHNGIFHVFGGERVRISALAGPPAFPANQRWYHAQLKFNGQTGEVQVTVDGEPIPALHAFDLSLRTGRVGLGSFDETADFRNVTIR